MWGGGTLAGGVAWYTTNSFGPGVDVSTPATVEVAAPNRDGSAALRFKWSGDMLVIQSPVKGAYTLHVIDAKGRISASYPVDGKGEFSLPAFAVGHGLRWIEATASNGQRWISAVSRL